MFPATTYGTKMNEGFIRPLKSVGKVSLNGMISKALLSTGCTNKNAYYTHDIGLYKEEIATVSRGDLVYTFHTPGAVKDNMSSDPNAQRADTSVVKGVAALNGQGRKEADGNFKLMTRIQVQGIADMPNDVNRKDRFNILIGGVHDVRNNGNETIYTGDHVIAYAPTNEEIKRNLNNRSPAEKSGLVKLWLKPYKPEIHKNHLKHIYNCLNDNPKQEWLDSYKRHCKNFTDSIFGMSAVVIAVLGEELKKDLNTPGDPSTKVANLLARMGHSEFAHNMNDQQTMTLRAKLLDALFTPFGNDVQDLFPGNDKLSRIQKGSTSQFMESTASFVNVLNNLVVGQAKSTGQPGQTFSLSLQAYSR